MRGFFSRDAAGSADLAGAGARRRGPYPTIHSERPLPDPGGEVEGGRVRRRGTRPALRLVVLLFIFTILFASVAVRLVMLQIVRAAPAGNNTNMATWQLTGLASGVVAAAKDLHVQVPIVMRMEGTNVERGQQILRESGLNFTIAEGMKDGAQKVVRLAAGQQA